MVMSMCEQAAQLRLKALPLRMLGFTPRSHQLRELLGTLLKTIERFGKPELAREVQNFVDEYREDLRALEEAYTGSRYLAGVFVEEEASEAVRVAENLFKLIEVIEDNVFS
jgi:HEPN domain-containing protein